MEINEVIRKRDDIAFVGEGNYVVGYGGACEETFHIESKCIEDAENSLKDAWVAFCEEHHIQEDCVDYIEYEPGRLFNKEDLTQWIMHNYDLPESNETLAPEMLDGILTYAQGLSDTERIKLLHMALPSLPESVIDAFRPGTTAQPDISKPRAATSWYIDDAINAANNNGTELSPEQADEWWNRNERAFHELLVEAGNTILDDMDFTSDGIIHMVRTSDHVDISKCKNNNVCYIDCDYKLTKDAVNSGVFPGLFADFCYGRNIPGKEEADTDTIFWIRFENDELPSRETLIAAYDEMVTFAENAGKLFNVDVKYDREQFLEDLEKVKSSNVNHVELPPMEYTHDRATEIVELFEDLLCEHGIKLPSPEDDDREDDNDAALYGSVYADILDGTEAILVEMLDNAEAKRYIPYVYSGNY